MPETSPLAASRTEVHQAAGIVSVQLDLTPTAALTHLQNYADTHQRPLRDVALDVIAHRLRFNPEP